MCRILSLLMARIFVVAYPEKDGQLRAQQQHQGASSGAGEGEIHHVGGEAAGHCVSGADYTNTDGHSGRKIEGLARRPPARHHLRRPPQVTSP